MGSAWEKKRRLDIAEFIRRAKSTPCLDCGVSYPSYVMCFDHVRGTKLFNIGASIGMRATTAKIQSEVDKCEIVCHNCHAIRTHTRKQE